MADDRRQPTTPEPRHHRAAYAATTTGESSRSAGGGSSSATTDPRHENEDEPRLSSAFILKDATSRVDNNEYSKRRSRSAQHNDYKGKESNSPLRRPTSPTPPMWRNSREPESPTARGDGIAVTKNMGQQPAATAAAALDADSTQIVNMALNLSESRRWASSRRHASASNPPRLAPLPDSAPRNNLGVYLQQNSRASRTGPPRTPSGLRASSSMLASGHDNNNNNGGQDGTQQLPFQVSASTLARVQKAKDHLELMAEYRRLLAYLPPLKPGHEASGSSASNQGSPKATPKNSRQAVASRDGQAAVIGRPYDPLQYIRNRKVRTRERKVIEGEQLGFGDVELVHAWVDRVIQLNPAGRVANTARPAFTMPPFREGKEGQEGQDGQVLSESRTKRARRPRVDWFFDPCDMIADAYWLEQDHHKQLIEDREWRRIFSPAAAEPATRPASRRVDESSNGTPLLTAVRTTSSKDENLNIQELRLDHSDDEAPGSTADRAKQKLHGLKGFHHMHSSSLHSYHDVHARRDSFSDASGTDSDMLSMVAKEAREQELENVAETDAEYLEPPRESLYPPAEAPASHSLSRAHSRNTSVADLSDSDLRLLAGSHPDSPTSHPIGRHSIDVTDDRGAVSSAIMAEAALSAPVSPGLRGRDPLSEAPDFAFDSPPALRRLSVSPTRNRLSKVRRKFMDKSYDSGMESQSDAEDEPADTSGRWPSNAATDEAAAATPTPKAHRSSAGVTRHRSSEDQYPSIGVRGFFKGPRLDTVIRGSVSKLGDLLWRKDDSDTSDEEEIITDDSGDEPDTDRATRGEGKQQQHFLDSMPQFQRASEAHRRSSSITNGPNQHLHIPAPDEPRLPSRQPSKWEQLKPPRIDISSAAPGPGAAVKSISHEDEAHQSIDGGGPREAEAAASLQKRRLSDISSVASPLDTRYKARRQDWSLTENSKARPERTQLSRREVARMRALILSSGIKAMEINRRANELRNPPRLALPPFTEDMYAFGSRALGAAVQASSQRLQESVDVFTAETAPDLQRCIWEVRSHVANDLSGMARQAADEADSTSGQLAFEQPLRVKHVADVIDKLLRKRRQRFRWVRRALWQAVEWLLVGFMWYVWLVVTVLKVFVGLGRGIYRSVRWLLWL
ncbi:hypothetical protein GMORB2_3915 [Geosmithia morbida]|uniref:Uncharacterized protein n=1 Tax=Geosmithia morbida TaxID=1094350 RepID=A0A9P4YXU7_9HYPO|nr:uncharacterized protein GMORB2_3915 [Geosmithia morbida]KAF4125076.1 hypothetical protein GMORB2_3915 [Geosmithia morbida]